MSNYVTSFLFSYPFFLPPSLPPSLTDLPASSSLSKRHPYVPTSKQKKKKLESPHPPTHPSFPPSLLPYLTVLVGS